MQTPRYTVLQFAAPPPGAVAGRTQVAVVPGDGGTQPLPAASTPTHAGDATGESRGTTVLLYDQAWLAALAVPSGIAPGAVLGERYHLVRRMGQGGMGEVWEARHIAIRKPVAIKLLCAGLDDAAHCDRFVREARLVARIAHPHVIEIFDFGQSPRGAPFFAMELLRGESLGARLQRCGPVPWARALLILRQIADALAAAHDVGVIHRDVKPDNVFLVERGGTPDFVKLLDFGIAKAMIPDPNSVALTSAGVVFGTPAYMSPEQLRGDAIDGRSDLYAVGCVAYQMLTGGLPFEGTTAHAIVAGHLFDDPRPLREATPFLRLPPAVEAIVLRCLQKHPAQRYESAAALRAAIDRVLATAPRQPRRPRARTGLALGLVCAGLVGVAAWQLHRVWRARTDASAADDVGAAAPARIAPASPRPVLHDAAAPEPRERSSIETWRPPSSPRPPQLAPADASTPATSEPSTPASAPAPEQPTRGATPRRAARAAAAAPAAEAAPGPTAPATPTADPPAASAAESPRALPRRVDTPAGEVMDPF
ncbi:MAG: serine/threonine protein kinase [Nannocystaceae bacterium]|nr:serine/threonine protein kinase [Nannocystaceae bacterium]